MDSLPTTRTPQRYTTVSLPMPPRKEKPSADTRASETAIASFETEFERLNAIVDKLERGNVPLGEMIALYEEAMTLSARLKSVLSEAELRVERLAAVHEENVGSSIQGNDILESEDLF